MKNLNSLSLRLENGNLFALDQVKLPHEEEWVLVESPEHMRVLIQNLSVRGAPLIGVAAALSLAVYAQKKLKFADAKEKIRLLREARPTAVNLAAAMNRMEEVLDRGATANHLMDKATEIFEEDVELCEKMGEYGASLIHEGDGILTHCNTGGLATVGLGTALAGIITAHNQGKKIHVYVDETRPLLQGGRLTTWELQKWNVPYTLICDNMAASLMSQGKIQKIFVGSDRIARNGDIANKIGTYSVAVLAHHHQIPFYVVAPRTTLDLSCPTGAEIPIEQRAASEVRGHGERVQWAPQDCLTYNPSFDVTPVDLISAIVLDTGIIPKEKLKYGLS